MKKLIEIVGGSHLYGLNTANSDLDHRYVFMHDDVPRTIGLDRFEHLDERGGEEDRFGFELRHYVGLLRKTNTQVLEILFAPEDKFTTINPLFKELIIGNRTKLIDSEKMFKSLRGYINDERKLANGERLGHRGIRSEAIKTYGFSPKNFTQLFRLVYTGVRFFKHDVYPVNIMEDNPTFAMHLLRLKKHPETFKLEELNEHVEMWNNDLVRAYEQRKTTYRFDEKLANNILLEFYFPMIASLYSQYKLP